MGGTCAQDLLVWKSETMDRLIRETPEAAAPAIEESRPLRNLEHAFVRDFEDRIHPDLANAPVGPPSALSGPRPAD